MNYPYKLYNFVQMNISDMFLRWAT